MRWYENRKSTSRMSTLKYIPYITTGLNFFSTHQQPTSRPQYSYATSMWSLVMVINKFPDWLNPTIQKQWYHCFWRSHPLILVLLRFTLYQAWWAASSDLGITLKAADSTTDRPTNKQCADEASSTKLAKLGNTSKSSNSDAETDYTLLVNSMQGHHH